MGFSAWFETTFQAEVANAIKNNLPLDVRTLLASPEWKGGPLLVVHSPLGRPPAAMLCKNYHWLLPLVQYSPAKASNDQTMLKINQHLWSIYVF